MKKYLDIILINLLSLLLGIILYYVFNHKSDFLIATIATGISLALGLRQYRTENDKLFKELFSEFNKKYDKHFNNKLIKFDKEFQKDPSYQLSDDDKILIIDYLNFCAEEYLWYTKDRIPKSVWISWENGMVYYLNIGCINELILAEKSQKDSYYGLFNKIGKRVNNWN